MVDDLRQLRAAKLNKSIHMISYDHTFFDVSRLTECELQMNRTLLGEAMTQFSKIKDLE